MNRDAEDKAPLAAEEEEEEEEVGDKASSTAAVAVVQDGDEDKDVVGESDFQKGKGDEWISEENPSFLFWNRGQ